MSSTSSKRVTAVLLAGLVTGLLLAGTTRSAAAQQTPFDIAISNGQFVYGPNVGDFDTGAYLAEHAPHLLPYADVLSGRAAYYSINPKVYLTLLEISAGLISSPPPDQAALENPFRLSEEGFVAELEALSDRLNEAFYSQLYASLPPEYGIPTPDAVRALDGSQILPAALPNAASYALADALASFQSRQQIEESLAQSEPEGFYQTYVTLFPGDDPLDTSNSIATTADELALPDNFLQFPFPQGQHWVFGGVHSWTGYNGTDMSSIDMADWWVDWNADTSNMWVAAAAGGTVLRFSDCYVRVRHADGWETGYYHLENIQRSGGTIQQNERIANIANTLEEAICNGGSSTGPHVHFGLMRNGAWTPLDGKRMTGWSVHAGRDNYDYDPDYMWLERNGIRVDYRDGVFNDTCPAPVPTSVLNGYVQLPHSILFDWNEVGQCQFAGYEVRVKDTPDMDSGGSLILSTQTAESDLPATIGSEWDRQNLYWGARAANAPNSSSWKVQQFRIEPFSDIPVAGKEWMQPWIESFYAAGVTTGCEPDSQGNPQYCPERAVTRAEMAVFILRALNYPYLPYTPPAGAGTFADMPVENKEWMEPWVESLYGLGITSGCADNPLQFCPERGVTRAEMAVFILRAKYGGSYEPPAVSGTFADMPVAGKEWMEPWIEQFYAEGITTGCAADPPEYCPEREVTRAEMAVFILRAFENLPNP